MRVLNKSFTVSTTGKGTYEITDKIEAIVRESKIENGVGHGFYAAHQLQPDRDGECGSDGTA